MQPAIDILLRNRNHQAKVGFHQILLGPLGFDFAVADYGHAVLEIGKRRAGRILKLANFTAQLTSASLGGQARAPFQLAQLGFQMGQLFDSVLDFLSELLPAGRQPGQMPDGLRHLHLGAIDFALRFAAELLVAERNRFQLVD